METTNCPLCNSKDCENVWQSIDFLKTIKGEKKVLTNNVVCKNCGLVFMNPVYTEEELAKIYGEQAREGLLYSKLDEARRVSLANRINSLKKKIEEGKLLEIGCAEGYFLETAVKHGFCVTGFEPSKKLANIAKKRLGENKIINDFFNQKKLEAQSFDIVSHFFVLEHMKQPRKFIEDCWGLLKNNGFLYFEVPVIEKFFIPNWTAHLFSSTHIVHFTMPILKAMLEMSGFRIIELDNKASYPWGIRVLAQKNMIYEKKMHPNYFLKTKKLIFDYEQHLKNERKKLQDKFLKNKIIEQIKKEKVGIFPGGADTRDLLLNIFPGEIDPIAIFDNNEQLWGLTCCGFTIYPPSKIKSLGITALLICSYEYQNEIYEQLKYLKKEGIKLIKVNKE